MVTDKDMSEIAAVKEIFPAAKQFVCVFHSLQAVKRRLSTARLLTDYFKEIEELFHEAVYTLDAYRFSEIEATLCTIDQDGLDEYFRIHWFEWEPELWALHTC